MDNMRAAYAKAKTPADFEAAWKAEQEQERSAARADRPDDPAPAAEKADHPEPADKREVTDQRTDHDADPVSKLENELAETKGELAETKSELAEEKTDRRKLTSVVADQAEEIKRLRAQLETKGKTPEQPAAGTDDVDSSPKTVASQDKPLSEPDRPWYKKVPVPSEKVTGLFTGAAGLVESVGVATHGMSGTTESIVGAAIGFGVAGIAYERERRKEQAEKEKQKNG